MSDLHVLLKNERFISVLHVSSATPQLETTYKDAIKTFINITLILISVLSVNSTETLTDVPHGCSFSGHSHFQTLVTLLETHCVFVYLATLLETPCS